MGIGQKVPVISQAVEGIVDGFNQVKIDVKVPRVDGTSVYLDFEADGGGDIPFRAGGKDYKYNCTTGPGPGGIGSVELIQGTLEEPIWQLIYMAYSENDSEVVAITSQRIPKDTGFGPVAYCVVPTYTDVSATQVVMVQRITDIPSDGYRGADSYLREKVRLALLNNRITGGDVELAITTNAGSRDNVNVKSLICQFYQLHEQEMDAQDASSDGIRMVGQDVGECTIGNNSVVTDLGLLAETGDGTTIASGETVIIDIIGIGCSCGLAMLGAVVSKTAYASAADAIHDAEIMPNMRYPKDIDQVCFTLARLILTYTDTDNGTWTNALSSTTSVWVGHDVNESNTGYPGYTNGMAEVISNHTYTGATMVRAYCRVDTEARYDFLNFKGASGSFPADVYARRTNPNSYAGKLGYFHTNNISGDTLMAQYTSDGSVIVGDGGLVQRIESLHIVTTGGGLVKDRR